MRRRGYHRKGEAPASAATWPPDSARLPDRQRNVLDSIPAPLLPTFLRFCRRSTFRKGTMLCTQGEPTGEFFIIIQGLVRTFYASPSGKEVTIGYWTRGDLVATTDIFKSGVREFSVRAIRSTDVLVLNEDELGLVLRAFPDIALLLVEALVFKIRRLSLLSKMLATQSVTGRVAQLLLILCRLHGVESQEGIVVETELSRTEVGQMIGVSRQWVTTTLNRFQDLGLLTLQRRRVVIHDLDALIRKAEQ